MRYLRCKTCKKHKNVSDSMVRDAKSRDAAETKKTGVKCTVHIDAHTATMKDDVLAALKIVKYEADSPVTVRGKKRGSFDHCEFFHRYSTAQIKREFKQRIGWRLAVPQSCGVVCCLVLFSQSCNGRGVICSCVS